MFNLNFTKLLMGGKCRNIILENNKQKLKNAPFMLSNIYLPTKNHKYLPFKS